MDCGLISGALNGLPHPTRPARAAAVGALATVQSLSAGMEKLLPHIRPGVAVSNGRGLHDASVTEHGLALVLAGQRDLPRRIRDQHARRRAPHVTRSLADTRAIIVGYGSIAAAIEHRLLTCGAEVVAVASRRRPAERVRGIRGLPQLLPHADIVGLALPQSPATVGLMHAGPPSSRRRVPPPDPRHERGPSRAPHHPTWRACHPQGVYSTSTCGTSLCPCAKRRIMLEPYRGAFGLWSDHRTPSAPSP
ncbi:NAD(P)-dependent oxidoreductase [Streptomyces spinosirectus]